MSGVNANVPSNDSSILHGWQSCGNGRESVAVMAYPSPPRPRTPKRHRPCPGPATPHL